MNAGYVVEDAESSWLVHCTPELAAWLSTLAWVTMFLGKTLYSEIDSLYKWFNAGN